MLTPKSISTPSKRPTPLQHCSEKTMTQMMSVRDANTSVPFIDGVQYGVCDSEGREGERDGPS